MFAGNGLREIAAMRLAVKAEAAPSPALSKLQLDVVRSSSGCKGRSPRRTLGLTDICKTLNTSQRRAQGTITLCQSSQRELRS